MICRLIVFANWAEGFRTIEDIIQLQHFNTKADWKEASRAARSKVRMLHQEGNGRQFTGEINIEFIDTDEFPKAYSKAAHAAEVKQRIESLKEMLREAEAEFKTLIS